MVDVEQVLFYNKFGKTVGYDQGAGKLGLLLISRCNNEATIYRAKQVEKFCYILEQSTQGDQPVELGSGYRALLFDIVNHFIFGTVPVQYQGLGEHNFHSSILQSTCNIFDRSIWLERNFPIIRRIRNLIPFAISDKIGSDHYYNVC